MAFICDYKLCAEPEKIIPEGAASACSICETGKPMHKACCEKHSAKKHPGKSSCESLKEPKFHFKAL